VAVPENYSDPDVHLRHLLLEGVETPWYKTFFKSLKDAWADTTTAHGRLMLTVLGGLAEFERELIRARTSEGRARAKARGVRLGRRPQLTPHQKREALSRRANGEARTEIARSYNVSHTTIARLTPSQRLKDLCVRRIGHTLYCRASRAVQHEDWRGVQASHNRGSLLCRPRGGPTCPSGVGQGWPCDWTQMGAKWIQESLSGSTATDEDQRETRYREHDSNESPQCHFCTLPCAPTLNRRGHRRARRGTRMGRCRARRWTCAAGCSRVVPQR